MCETPVIYTVSKPKKRPPVEGLKIGANSTKAAKICKSGQFRKPTLMISKKNRWTRGVNQTPRPWYSWTSGSLEFWILHFSSEFLPKFGFFEDIPRPRQLGLVDSWTILPAGPAVVLISWLVPPLPFHCRAALLRNGAVTRSSTRSPTRWCGLLALTSP